MNRNQIKKIFVIMLVILFTINTVQAAGFIKFDGVDGESQDKDHRNWSDILSFILSINSPTSGESGRASGRVIFDNLVITREIDKSSPKIAEALATGKVFPKVVIHVTKTFTDAGRVTYYSYELKNVMVTKYEVSGSTHSEERPIESLSLSYGEIKQVYTIHDDLGRNKGIVEFIWNLMRR